MSEFLDGEGGGPAIAIRGLDFRYPGGAPVLRGLALDVPRGVRCLLVGKNGAGKSTLLSIVAGRHMVPDEAVRVLGRPAFTDTSLAERVALLGGTFPFDVDVGVNEILARQWNVDEARRDRLVALLGVDPAWRMSRVSDGQRRRVQILLALLRPADVLLLDEVTTDLDVVARADLLGFLRDETARGATILYATHIFDGLEEWATHLAFLDGARVRLFAPLDGIDELRALREGRSPAPLLRLVERWLRAT